MVENLDDCLGIFGARFPYFECDFQFRFLPFPFPFPFLNLRPGHHFPR